ncbi:helix-turn-helix domain-containing protein [Leucobacter muris]|uniref:Helix-turn-helix domain-containing protein n=2 Tax=Leucobacter muris TaxID=1935379 RepID=A0ABX5QJE7_9MICO|nr:helix-turn-helix domain-containing protein [Leucobacter muris]
MPHTRLFDVVPENSVRFLGHDTHTHPVPHLIHVVSGTADLVVDGAPVHLDAKENLWLAADVPHSAQYAPDSVVLGPFLSPGTTPPVPMRVLGVVPRLTEIARMILGASPRTDAQIRVFREALDEVLLDLDAPYFALRMPTHPVAREVARAAVASDLTLERLAARRRTSVRHVQRLFRDETDLPFTNWRARAKLNVAISRLRAGDSVPAAAHYAGYASRASLLKSLSRESGVAQRLLADDPLTALETRATGA